MIQVNMMNALCEKSFDMDQATDMPREILNKK
jgi:hypothetical protein